MTGTVLVAGASGIVGRAALEHFASLSGWRAVGVSRRRPDALAGEHLAVDLGDRAAAAAALGALDGVSHVVFAALYEKPGLIAGWKARDQMETNLTLLRNCLEPLMTPALRHVSLLQGTKAYGVHHGLMRVPGREREARVEHENFYWLQEDWLRAAQRGSDWHFTIWRPPLIIGHAVGAPMNLLAAWAAHAALQQARGEPLGWPGNATRTAYDAVDAALLARAFAWAAAGRAGVNETYNVSNGDVFVPHTLWPKLASAFGLDPGPDAPQRLGESLPAAASTWRALSQRHGLRCPDLGAWLGDSPIYADVFLNPPPDPTRPSPLLSTIKLRQAGFADCMDTEDMFLAWIERLRALRYLPPR